MLMLKASGVFLVELFLHKRSLIIAAYCYNSRSQHIVILWQVQYISINEKMIFLKEYKKTVLCF